MTTTPEQTELAQEAFSRAAEICAEMAREAALKAARQNSTAQDTGDEYALGAAAQYNAQSDTLREAQKRIEDARFNAAVAPPARPGSVWDEAIEILKAQPYRVYGDFHEEYIARFATIAKLKAARPNLQEPNTRSNQPSPRHPENQTGRFSMTNTWGAYDALFDAIHLIDLARLNGGDKEQLGRVRAYLSEQAAELLPWGRGTRERSPFRLARGYEGVEAGLVRRL